MPARIRLFDIDIDNLSFEEALAAIDDFIKGGSRHYVATPNVDHIIRLQRDAEFKKVYDSASLILADGMPLVWASRFTGKRLKERVAGSDLFPDICKLAEQNGYSIFLLGSRQEVVNLTMAHLKKLCPHLIIAGMHHGFFAEEDTDAIVNIINSASPHILFLGMGSPKQELWIMRNISRLDIKIALCVGGSFEILAGIRKRAPVWMQKTGLEWFYRLIQEPGRLWKRYLVDDMIFFQIFMKELWRVRIKRG